VQHSRFEYLEQGSGEPVILLHCSASSSAQWRTLIARLGDRYRVFAPDLHGYGGTAPWTGNGRFSLAFEAQIVHTLLGRAGAPVHLVGHSYGGAVAMHVARTRPDLLASLTVIEPVAFHLLKGVDDAAFAEIREVAAKLSMPRFVDYWSGPGAWESIPQERRPALAACLPKVARDFEATFDEPATLQDFAEMALPTLVVQGSESPRPARRICELLARHLPDVEHKVVAGAGHMAPLTHRNQVNDLIAARLETLERLAA
jgi:pimeloyl-ACP methyl ester carboxylesterase